MEALVVPLKEHPLFFGFFVAFFALFIGSFLNVVIARVPQMLQNDLNSEHLPATPFNLFFPRSHCPNCKSVISWFHNIPVFSFLYLSGKCVNCRSKISAQYPIVELLTALLSFIIAIRFGLNTTTAMSLLLVWALIALTFIDINHTILPDTITLPFLWLGLLINTFGIFTPPSSAILGAIYGYLSLWIVYWVFKWLTQKEGIGYGDFKLFAMLGAWFGWQSLPFIILISSILGSLVGISLILFKGKNKNSEIPFGPFLAIAGLTQLLLGKNLIHQYVQLLRL